MPSRSLIARSWQRVALSDLDPAVSVEDYDKLLPEIMESSRLRG
ncbi:hypothetical protein [Nocardia suismassiliense]|nr:hypothetical protein [Nocardia suismassiliense]